MTDPSPTSTVAHPPTASDRLLDTLMERLHGREGLEIEFKRARGGLPKELWPTVSAFANTNGGWILLGVREEEGESVVEGLANPAARLQELNDLLRNPQKLSTPVCGAADTTIETLDGRPVLVVRVPAAPRQSRPVYINGNPYTGTYVRRHAGDYLCTKQEVDRMVRDASDVAVDSTVLPHYGLDDLDDAALARYRRRFQTNAPESPFNAYGDLDFLRAVGGYRRDRQTGAEGLTVAGLLLLGTPAALREWRQRHLIDYRLLPAGAAAHGEQQWDDRVAWDGHLFGAFEVLYPKLVENQPRPFRTEGGARVDRGPVHEAMREALVNLLVHADYGETQASLITRAPEGYFFRNPGSSRVPEGDLRTGDRSDPRNPTLVGMFRGVGLADEGGTGIPKILRAWQGVLGLRPPTIDSGTERYEFSLTLRHAHLLSDGDRRWLDGVGAGGGEAERLALLLARDDGDTDNLRLRRLTGQHTADASRTLVGLRDRGLLRMDREGRRFVYRLAGAAGEATAEASLQGSGESLPERSEALNHDRKGLHPTDPSLLGSRQSLRDSAASLPDSATSLPGKEPDADPLAPDPAVWAELWTLAESARRRPRLRTGERDALLVALCTRAALSRRELASLLGRNEDYVSQAATPLVRDGRLAFLYPERASHPRQRYIGGPRATSQGLDA